MAVPSPSTSPDPALDDEKAALRRLIRFRRREFVDAAGQSMLGIHAVAIARLAFHALPPATSMAAYLANSHEVDPLPLLALACEAGMETALPHIDRRGGKMRFLSWRPGEPLREGPYGVAQPLPRAPEIAPGIVIAPLLAFDRQGHRLGQGGGFYDRAFAALPDARRIGLAWSAQEIARVPVASWDLPLHAVATEREWMDFT